MGGKARKRCKGTLCLRQIGGMLLVDDAGVATGRCDACDRQVSLTREQRRRRTKANWGGYGFITCNALVTVSTKITMLIDSDRRK